MAASASGSPEHWLRFSIPGSRRRMSAASGITTTAFRPVQRQRPIASTQSARSLVLYTDFSAFSADSALSAIQHFPELFISSFCDTDSEPSK